MARSIAVRLPRLLGAPAARSRARTGRGSDGALPRRGVGALARVPRAAFALILARRGMRIVVLALLLALPALAGGWLLLRDSPLVSVERVELSGVNGPDAAAIDAALSTAALRMSTLDVNRGALLAAVAPFRVVRAVQATPSFPHALRIRVLEQPPVAALVVAGARTAVAADGVVLGTQLLTRSMPLLDGSYAPLPGERLKSPAMLDPLALLGAAPAALERQAARVYTSSYGLTVAMRDGLLVYFGDARLPHAKWLSLARVLADPSSAGAAYIDVRLPTRPAAGFPAGVAPPYAGGEPGTALPTEPSSTPEGTIAALAAGLTGSGSGTGSTTSGTEATAGAATGATAPSAGASESPPAAQGAAGAPAAAAPSAPGGETSATAGQPGG